MDYDLTGTVYSRIGNRSMWGAPQGVYPCAGNERWIAISAIEAEDWTTLRSLVGQAIDPEFDDASIRNADQDRLDEQIAAWTSDFEVEDLAYRLQAAGIAAHVVSTNEDLLHDTHVTSREWYQVAPSNRLGRDVFSGCAVKLSATPGRWTEAGPSMGQHTREILSDVVGLSDEAIDDLISSGGAFEQIEPDMVATRPWNDWIHLLVPGTEDARDL